MVDVMDDNMNDRELLELAAKAAGYVWREDIKRERDKIGVDALWVPHVSTGWNPLKNSGDALRLAVACQLGLSIAGGRARLVECVSFKDLHCFVSSREIAGDGDIESATRRAIVRAAAEIGRQM